MTKIGLLAVGITIGVVAGAVGLITHDIILLALGHYAND